MRGEWLVQLLVIGWFLLPGTLAWAEPTSELLINEVYLSDDLAFVELKNHGTQEVELRGHHLSNSPEYAQVAASVVPSLPGGFVARFRADQSLEPGEHFVVALWGVDAYMERFGVRPNASLEESEETLVLTPAFSGAVREERWSSQSGGLVLFFWEGEDLVKDIDVLLWGSGGPVFTKAGLAVDGSDEGDDPSTYPEETPPAQQWRLGSFYGFAAARVGLEVGELEGGSGIGGQDELSEPWPRNFSLTPRQSPGEANALAWLVEGEVRRDGAPLSEAWVRLPGLGVASETDQGGGFSLGLITEGQHQMVVEASGSPLWTEPLIVEGEDLELVVTLDAGRRVYGRVLLDGVIAPALAGTRVEVLEGEAQAITDGDGDYLLGPLAPGEVVLRFVRQGYEVETTRLVIGEEDLRVDNSLRPSLRVLFEVQLISSEGLDAGVRVSLDGGPQGPSYAIETEASGSPWLGFPDVEVGEYCLVVDAPGHLPLVLEGLKISSPGVVMVKPIPRSRDLEIGLSCQQSSRAGSAPVGFWVVFLGGVIWRRSVRL